MAYIKQDITENTDMTPDVFNHQEDGIEAAHNLISSHQADYVRQPGYINPTTGTSTAYIGSTIPALTAYVEGIGVTIVLHVACGNNPTFNWNAKGAVALLKQDGSAYSAGEMLAGKPYSFKKVGTSFLADSSGDVKIAGQAEITVEFAGTIAKNDPVSITFKSNMNLPAPTVLPSSFSRAIEFSSDDVYLAIAYSGSPCVAVYKRNGDVFTKLADIPGQPTTTAYGLSWSSDGVYLALAISVSPYVLIYKRNGDTFTKLSDPSTLPVSTGQAAAFSPDTNYLTIGHGSSPYITIYKRSGDTFTKLSNPSTLPPSGVNGACFDDTNTYLVASHDSSPYITIYKRNVDTFTKLSNPPTTVGAGVKGVAFYGVYLAVTRGANPGLYMYKRELDVFNLLSAPLVAFPSGAQCAGYSPDGKILALGASLPPLLYKVSDGELANLSNISPALNGTPYGVSFSSVSQYLAFAMSVSPFIVVYKLQRVAEKVNNNDAVGLLGKLAMGYAKESGVAGENKKVIEIWR